MLQVISSFLLQMQVPEEWHALLHLIQSKETKLEFDTSLGQFHSLNKTIKELFAIVQDLNYLHLSSYNNKNECCVVE